MTYIEELEEDARKLGLYLTTYSPGDGYTRYRFSRDEGTYFSVKDIFTALGRGQAELFLRGVTVGSYYEKLKLQKSLDLLSESLSLCEHSLQKGSLDTDRLASLHIGVKNLEKEV